MTLLELITAVKEKNLQKDQLEDYRDQLSELYARMCIELAEKEKEKAIFFDVEKQNSLNPSQEQPKFPSTATLIIKTPTNISDISIQRKWSASKNGQREIELKRYCLATKEMLNSLKSRLYSIY